MSKQALRRILVRKSQSINKVCEKKIIDKLFPEIISRKSFAYIKNVNIKFVDSIKFNTVLCPVLSKDIITDVKDTSLIDSTITLERLEEAKLLEEPAKKKQNTLLSIVFLIINLVLVFIIAKGFLASTDSLNLSDVINLQGRKLWWLIGALGCTLILVFAESCIFTTLVKHTTGKFRPLLSYKTAITGKYYESITPLAVGAQPSQIIYLSKHDVNPGIASSIPIIKMIVYNSMFAIISLLFFVFVMPTLSTASDLDAILQILMKVLAVIGLIISSLTVIVIMIIATSKKFGRSLARFVIRLGVMFHIVKNYRASFDKLMRSVAEFQSSVNFLKKNKIMAISCMLFCVLEVFSFMSTPFFVVLAFGGANPVGFGEYIVLWLECCARFLMSFMASSFIPLPGGTGMTELTFICLFGGSAFLGENIFWGFLAFRLLTYYQWILQGLVLTITEMIMGFVKNYNQKKLDKSKVTLK